MASKYGFETTAEEIARGHDLTGKNVIVTGGYSGIGRETARVFALQGANVFIIGRDLPKAKQAAEELKAETGKQHITALEADLSSFASVRSFAEQFNKLNLPLHYLILNAGVMACPYTKSKDGFELQFATNFLGHFLLTNLLLPRLLEGAPARVVSVSSSGHTASDILWDDYNFEKGTYHSWIAYGQSKTANILFAVELNRRYKDKGITANSLHPGYIRTELQRHVNPDTLTPEQFKTFPGIENALKYSINPKTVGQGAATTLYATLAPETAGGGKFYDDNHEVESLPYASDPESAKKLWDLGAKLVGL